VDSPLLIPAMIAAIAWLTVIAIPIRPTGTRERLDAASSEPADLSDVTALIPARNEAALILQTLDALARQGTSLSVVVVDDQSDDETADLITSWPGAAGLKRLHMISGSAPESGWVGKVWAQAQGLEQVDTPLVLLIDADIELAPGMLGALMKQLSDRRLGLVSVMARLRTDTFWERLLAPAYVYFFKLLYPFALVNSADSRFAAAAGGCMLARRDALEKIGGFEALRDAIIDDCTLAGLIQRAGFPIWLGLTGSVTSTRPCESFNDFWNLVTRSAFAELKFSVFRLLICTGAMVILFLVPVLASTGLAGLTGWVSLIALLAMFASYTPMLVYYGLNPLRSLTLPLVAIAYLAMTWHSAIRYWRGTRTVWKGRQYER
jgi:hopene-associated glycosyltransferase HpnB